MTPQEQANQCIAQGALTNSKRPSTFVEGVYPTHLTKGNGCYVWDTDKRKYIDFICGLGTNLLGYANIDVNDAIVTQLNYGATLSLSTTLEIDAANRVKSIMPFVDQMKFLKTGSEACMAAIRIARAHHGLSKTKPDARCFVLSDGYHGQLDEFISLTDPALGVETMASILPLIGNENLIKSAAAVIIEPVITDWSAERVKWLKDLRAQCSESGTLLIFDEIITGFRFPRFCVANYFGVEPDLILLGKAIANGMPLSVVGGKKEIMSGTEYFVSSTFAGETLSLAAAIKTIDLLKGSRYSLDNLWQKGGEWLDTFNALWPGVLAIEGYPTRGRFVGDDMIKALFFQQAIDSGLLFGPSWFWNFSHIQKSETTLSACKDIVCKIKSGNVKLRGKMPQSPFAEKMRR